MLNGSFLENGPSNFYEGVETGSAGSWARAVTLNPICAVYSYSGSHARPQGALSDSKRVGRML